MKQESSPRGLRNGCFGSDHGNPKDIAKMASSPFSLETRSLSTSQIMDKPVVLFSSQRNLCIWSPGWQGTVIRWKDRLWLQRSLVLSWLCNLPAACVTRGECIFFDLKIHTCEWEIIPPRAIGKIKSCEITDVTWRVPGTYRKFKHRRKRWKRRWRRRKKGEFTGISPELVQGVSFHLIFFKC